MSKKIMIIMVLAIIVVGLIVACATVMQPNKNNNTNNTVNNTTNTTNNTVNATPIGNTSESTGKSSSGSSNTQLDSKSESDPEYGSDEYVAKWDESQRNGDSWAYRHKQPTKSEDGQSYHRMYNPDTGESYWQKGL